MGVADSGGLKVLAIAVKNMARLHEHLLPLHACPRRIPLMDDRFLAFNHFKEPHNGKECQTRNEE